MYIALVVHKKWLKPLEISLSFEVYYRYLLLKNIKCEQSAAKTATTGPIYQCIWRPLVQNPFAETVPYWCNHCTCLLKNEGKKKVKTIEIFTSLISSQAYLADKHYTVTEMNGVLLLNHCIFPTWYLKVLRSIPTCMELSLTDAIPVHAPEVTTKVTFLVPGCKM